MCSAGAYGEGCDTSLALAAQKAQCMGAARQGATWRKSVPKCQPPVGTEGSSGGEWVFPPPSRSEELVVLVTSTCWEALGNALRIVLGLGWCQCPPGLCAGDGAVVVPPMGMGFSPSLLEVGEDADGHDEGGQGDGVADGVHQVQAVKHLLEEKGSAPRLPHSPGPFQPPG